MSGMVEQVAKAMWDTRRAHANNAGIDLEFWGDGTFPKANGIMDEARAAISAMGQPTEEMTKAAAETCNAEWFTPKSAEECWKLMIAHALAQS